jgi:hypothetical protein
MGLRGCPQEKKEQIWGTEDIQENSLKREIAGANKIKRDTIYRESGGNWKKTEANTKKRWERKKIEKTRGKRTV